MITTNINPNPNLSLLPGIAQKSDLFWQEKCPTHNKFVIPDTSRSEIEQDYIDLFSHTRKGHMTKYIHMFRPSLYEDILDQDTYYPFKMECDLLREKGDQIVSNLQGVTEAVEIGPGSQVPVKSKTIPLLRSLRQQFNIDVYKAMDINPFYAKQACKIIQGEFPNIKTKAIEVDFLSRNFPSDIAGDLTGGKRVIFGLGQSIVSNNTDKETLQFLHNIKTLMGKEDYLLFGVDTNEDEETLERAYNTRFFHELLLNTMYFLRDAFCLKDFNPEAFELVYRWDVAKKLVYLLLKPVCNQIVNIKNKKLMLSKDQEFHITSSRKFPIDRIKEFLTVSELEMKDSISLDHFNKNKFSIVVAQKKK